MNYILHLTDYCNLNCKYCYENKREKELSIENIKAIIDYEIKQKNKNSNIVFYGGEPLLKKDIIYQTIDYIKSKKSKTKFYFGMTTNGTLIDDEFIKYMKDNKFINVAYSFDGIKEVQNLNRIKIDNTGSFDIVEQNAKKMLKELDNVVAMVVVTKNNIEKLEESVKYLLNLGFKTINLQFDYLTKWEDSDLQIIKEQYSKVGQIYYERILEEKDINFGLFEEKIKTYIDGKYDCNEDCGFGLKTVNVGTDGKIYPCMQFVYEEGYEIGDFQKGIDFNKRNNLLKNIHQNQSICEDCDLKKRCKHACYCKNYMITKSMYEVSPIVCEMEKIIIDISDDIAEQLYKNKSKLFLQKFYNKKYNIIEGVLHYGNKKCKRN